MRSASLAALLVAATAMAANTTGYADEKPRKPRLDLRASPRFAFSPVNVSVTAELRGGDDHAEFYCPEVEWDWDDGGRSVRESDCAPQEEGGEMVRRFTASHAFRQAGTYHVKVILRRNDRTIATTSTSITVRAGAGDMTSVD
jgi:hypothetical protein